jgi:chemotaxis protein histidine kinase CheA
MEDNKQQIVHYFIEEAQEHLDVVEQGLLELGEVIKDADRVNELFRAAHSVKGGAAMLGFESIQKTAHKLEDCFKILRDREIPVDREIETMFLKGYDVLRALVNTLAESPALTLPNESVAHIIVGSEANFKLLIDRLESLLDEGTIERTAPTASSHLAEVGSRGVAVMAPPVKIAPAATDILRQMLPLFKQGEGVVSRQQIRDTAQKLTTLATDCAPWQQLIRVVDRAIANPQAGYNTIAPLAIKELKQAAEDIDANKGNGIVASAALQQLAPISPLPIVAAATVTPPATPAPVTIPIEPRAAAATILKSFSRQQAVDLVKILHAHLTAKQN